MGEMLTRLTLPGTMSQVRYVTPVRPRGAPELVTRVYAQVAEDFGMLAPPMLLHSPAPEALAAAWCVLRESLLARGRAGRAAKEVVATAVSAGNTCPYCVDVHQATLSGLLGPARAVELADDPALLGVDEWAWSLGTRDSAAPLDPPVPAEQAAELAGVAVTFHYLNRMVNVFLGDSLLPPQVPARARGGLLRMFGLVMRPMARRGAVPGRSLELLPAAPPAADLAFADGAPHVAGAFARAAHAIDEIGRRSVPSPVRALVAAELAAWDGRPPGLGRGWADGPVSGLPPEHRAAGRLALLTAMASYQVDAAVVDAFRAGAPQDRALVELTSWAAMAAAREVGSWTRAVAAREPHSA
ncbi:carboxymuconolactone decarboxylase family protein [Sphaerisporangium aureirubrum]|uniref:Carboxymuconolactone decarboxylase family protein n=1 Tax=Sphaerisporangium aureirubrum TaxID=1544736 RepID=A0ABW1N9Z0_9ACTN